VKRIERFFFAPASPVNLGAIRIGLFALTATFVLQESVAADVRRGSVNWRPASFFRLLPGPPTPGALRTIQVAAIVAAILASAGLFTRVTQRVATPLAAYVLAFDSNFGKVNHRSMLLVLLLIALLPARTGEALSLDRLIRAARERRARPVLDDARYRWPVALAQVTVVSVYFFAGLSKLVNGRLEWFTGGSFQRFLYVRLDQLAHPPRAGLWLAAHPGWAQAAAIASVAFELSVALALIKPVLRRVIIPGLVIFHESTRLLTRINFTRTLLAGLVPLLDWGSLGRRLRTERPKSTVLYDGACGLCRRSAAVLWTTDALHRLEFADARDEALLRARFSGVDPRAALEDMHLVTSQGRVYVGFDAYRRMASLIPLGWPVLPLLYLPGVPWLGRKVYRRVADSRIPILHCAGGSCEVDHGHEPLPAREPVETH
jgi:predicted DCC family thiol-disulfide oxidoreductase YuxK